MASATHAPDRLDKMVAALAEALHRRVLSNPDAPWPSSTERHALAAAIAWGWAPTTGLPDQVVEHGEYARWLIEQGVGVPTTGRPA